MPLSAGTYTPPSPEYPAIPNTTILASDFNAIVEDLATALSLAIYKDGQASMAADLSMATHKLTNLADGSNDADAVNFDQVFHNPTFTGSTGTGTTLSGTKATIDATEFDVTSDIVSITGVALDLLSDDLSLTSSATIDATATTSITFTAPTIINIGSLIATLDTTSTAVTQLASDSSTKLATTAFVQSVAFQSALPTLTGNNGKLLTITAGVVEWGNLINVTVNSFADGTDSTKRSHLVLTGITAGQDRALIVRDENYTLVGSTSTDALKLLDYTDPTKIAKVQASAIATGTTRTLNLVNNDVIVDTPGWRLLSVISVGNQATIDITGFDSTYDKYAIEVDGLTVASHLADLYCRFKIGGSYLSTNEYNYHSTRLGVAVTPVSADSQIMVVTGLSNASAASAQFTMKLANVASTAFSKNICYDGTIVGSSNTCVHFVGGGGTISSANAALTEVRLLMSAGNFLAGSVKLYGLRKSI